MKYLVFVTIGIILLVSLSQATEYAATAFRHYSTTKAPVTYRIAGKRAVTVRPTAATSAYLNGKGADWLIAAGESQNFYPFRNISTIKFTCASTASTNKARIRIQEF